MISVKLPRETWEGVLKMLLASGFFPPTRNHTDALYEAVKEALEK